MIGRMTILDIVNRTIPPQPWVEGEKIPWDDPEFSRRMLSEHLSQDHNAASRTLDVVRHQVDYIEKLIGSERIRKGTVLDLACGPGLHSHELARRGYTTFGVDFSPASIEWAWQEAVNASLNCRFVHEDVRTAYYGEDFDLAMFLFGEIDVFNTDDLKLILNKSHDALKPGGVLLLEPHRSDAVRKNFESTPMWSSHESGLFSDAPHLLLEEGFWHEESSSAVKRWFVIDAQTGAVSAFSQTVVSRSEERLRSLVEDCGFKVSVSPEDWPTGDAKQSRDFYPLVAIAE